MGQQNFRRTGRVTRLIEQFFQEARHGLRVKARALQHLNPDAVRFLFVLLGKADHSLARSRQRTGQGRHPGLRAGHRQQNRAQRAHPGEGGVTFLVFHGARQVALGDVRNFVRHYRGQLAFVVRVTE